MPNKFRQCIEIHLFALFLWLCLESEIPKYHKGVCSHVTSCQARVGNTQNFMRKVSL